MITELPSQKRFWPAVLKSAASFCIQASRAEVEEAALTQRSKPDLLRRRLPQAKKIRIGE